MDGPVFQAAAMDFPPGLFADDPVAVIHHIKDFVAQVGSSLQKSVNTSKLTFSARSSGEMRSSVKAS